MVYCGRCGTKAEPDDSYCRICGRSLGSDSESADLIYCDQCGVKVNPDDTSCRICGRSLRPTSALWRLRRAVSAALRRSKPAPVEPAPSREAPSIAAPSITVAEESQSAPLRSPDPSPVQLLQHGKSSLTPDSLMAENDGVRTLVLEKASITNRKRPIPLRRRAFAKSGDTLSRAITKPPIAPSQLETKSELGPSSLTSKTEALGKAQANVHVPPAKSDAEPTSLIPKLEELDKTQASIGGRVSKRRYPSSSSLIGYALVGLGGLSLIISVIFTSTVLAFIGLGLTFWGALLLFIRPRYYVRTDLMDSTALSSLKTIDRVITGLGYNEKGIYIPVGNPEKTVVFVSSQPLKEIPKAEQVENQTFVKNPEGITIVPPGMALANLFEEELGVKFNEWSLEKMTERLPKLLIEDLEMVQDCTIKIDGDRVSFRFVESVFSEFCGLLMGSTKVCSSLGCPMCSAMACILAQVTHRPVKFDEDKYTVDGTTVESSYRLLTS